MTGGGVGRESLSEEMREPRSERGKETSHAKSRAKRALGRGKGKRKSPEAGMNLELWGNKTEGSVAEI